MKDLHGCLAPGEWSELPREKKLEYINKAQQDPSPVPKKAKAEPAPEEREPAFKPLDDTVRQTKRHVDDMTQWLSKFSSASDAARVVVAAVKELEPNWPTLGPLICTGLQEDSGSSSTCPSSRRLLEGLACLPGFEAPYPGKDVFAIRDAVDRLVGGFFTSREQVAAAGYKMGASRWNNSKTDDTSSMRRPRGRPSKRNDPELIASVLAQLNAHSQDSSRVCFDKTEGSWVQVQTLTRDATSIWHEQEELRQNMSLRTMRRIMKQHLAHFKPAWSVSDMCIYCVDLQKKVLPQSEELITGVRQRLEAFMGSYFEAFDEYANTVQLKSKPGLHLRELRHYIWHHSEAQPCQKHSSHSFPCGRLADRARGSGFPQNQRVQLHGLEAECCVKLQAQAKLLDGYLFHRSANEHQKPILTKLQEFPEPGHLTMLSDWKELFTLPVRAVKTGEEFYANSRMEISIFGSVLTERLPGGEETLTTHVLILSPILDHTACRTCQCLQLALEQRKQKSLKALDLISDSGGHFRSYENLWFNSVHLVSTLGCQVRTHYGVEKHMKASADRLFGLFETYMKIALRRQVDIVEIVDLRNWLELINREFRHRDPTAPNLVVLLDTDSKKVPASQRFKLRAPNLSISKTYCLSSVPVKEPYYRLGVKVYDHIFSSMATATNLTSDMYLDKIEDDKAAYRMGFWTKQGRDRWDTNPQPLGRHEESTLSKRMAKHALLLPEGANAAYGTVDFSKLVESKKKQQQKEKERRKKKQLLQKQATQEADADDSSTSSSSSDSSSTEP